MENSREHRAQKRLRGEQELLDMHLNEVLPAELDVNRDEFADLISEYIKDFQRVYSSMSRTVSKVQLLIYGQRIDRLQEKAKSELAVLDRIMPIEGTILDLIPWDVSAVEAAFYEEEPAKSPTWSQFVQAMGKRMGDSYPVED